MDQMNLYSGLTQAKATYPIKGYDRLPEQLPPGPVAFDFETTGLKTREGARPFALAIANATEEWCFQWNDNTIEWVVNQLAGRELRMAEAKFDIGMALADGVSLEDIGARPHDVQHDAALLDDRRRKFALDVLAKDRLGRGKAILPPGPVHELPVEIVAPYARQDARLTFDLAESYQPDIEKEGLERVLKLENDLLYCTLSMEQAGTPLDMPKLLEWIDEVESARVERILELWRRTGLRINPNSGPDLTKLFAYLGLGHSGSKTEKGAESFTEPILEEFAKDSRDVTLALEVRQLDSFLSKYLIKYRDAVDSRGVLHYNLHQLRADEGGTITGRYASSDVNIQQVMKPDKQADVLKPWILRELFKSNSEYGLLDSDMSQVEYRLFAHYAEIPRPHSTRLAEAYRKNPKTDFHVLIMEWTQLSRSHAKNVNFAKLYGAWVDKIAMMMGIDVENAQIIVDKYDVEFPEASRLLKYTERLAKRRGYVKTMLGRRRRYYAGDRYYSALNSVLQGGAAELMKLKLLHLYRERKTTGYTPWATVHDEHYGCMLKKNTRELVDEIHAVQELPLKVPILWSTGTGNNWYEAMKA